MVTTSNPANETPHPTNNIMKSVQSWTPFSYSYLPMRQDWGPLIKLLSMLPHSRPKLMVLHVEVLERGHRIRPRWLTIVRDSVLEGNLIKVNLGGQRQQNQLQYTRMEFPKFESGNHPHFWLIISTIRFTVNGMLTHTCLSLSYCISQALRISEAHSFLNCKIIFGILASSSTNIF